MKPILNTTLVASLLLLLSTFSHATPISLADYVQALYESHPTLKRLHASDAEQQATLQQQYAKWDTQLFFNGSYSKGLSSSFSSDFSPNTNSIALSAGRTKTINGSTHTLSSYHNQTTDIPNFGEVSLEDIFQFGISYTVTKPLLRDYQGRLTQSEQQRISLQSRLLSIKRIEDEEEFLYQRIAAFYDWVRLKKRVDLLAEEIQKASNQYQLTHNLYKQNLVEKQDELRAKKRLKLTELSYANEKNALAIQTALIQKDMGLSEAILPDLTRASLANSRPLSDTAVFSSRPFQLLDELHNDNKLALHIAEELNKKQVDLTAGVTAGAYGTDLSSMAEDFGSSNEFKVAIAGSFSDEQHLSKSAMQASISAAQRIHEEKKQLAWQLGHNYEQLSSMHALFTRYSDEQKDIIALSESIEALEIQAYKRAQRSSLITIIETQRDLLQDQLQLIEFDFQKKLSYLGLLQLNDALLTEVQHL